MPADVKQPRGELSLRTLAMPADVNVNADNFGGWVLSQMDIAAGIVASGRANGRVATIAIESMKLIRPVRVGNVMCISSEIERVARTSMATRLEAWALRNRGGAREKATEGYLLSSPSPMKAGQDRCRSRKTSEMDFDALALSPVQSAFVASFPMPEQDQQSARVDGGPCRIEA